MISPFIEYVNNLKISTNLWKEKTAGPLTAGKIDAVRDSWLALEPVRTLSHINNVRLILSGTNVEVEEQALIEARKLKEQLEFTADTLTTLSTGDKHPEVIDKALEMIKEAIKENDQLLLDIGRRRHEREQKVPPAVASLSERVQALQKLNVAAGSTAPSKSEEAIIPPSASRPFRTMVRSSTDIAGPIARELLLGIRNDTTESLLGKEGVGYVAVPAQFAQDATRGTYLLNGQPIYTIGESIGKAVEAYRLYCNALEGISRGYAVASLLVQSHFGRHIEEAQEILKPLYATGQGNTFDVTVRNHELSVKGKMVFITLKIVMEGVLIEDMSRKHAILMKTELSFPLDELEGAIRLAEEVRKTAKTEEQANEAFAVLIKNGVVLPSLKAVDSISSRIATAELGNELLKEF